jgi:hypothetical protein
MLSTPFKTRIIGKFPGHAGFQVLVDFQLGTQSEGEEVVAGDAAGADPAPARVDRAAREESHHLDGSATRAATLLRCSEKVKDQNSFK